MSSEIEAIFKKVSQEQGAERLLAALAKVRNAVPRSDETDACVALAIKSSELLSEAPDLGSNFVYRQPSSSLAKALLIFVACIALALILLVEFGGPLEVR
jgi:hypothetical protein